jgi:hypothetical protein
MPPGNSYYPQTQPQQRFQGQQGNPGTGKFGGMANQQQQPFQQANQQQPFQQQGGQPDYSSILRSIAGMFGQQGGAPISNYNPVQSANDFQLRNTYQFNPATDPSRILADKTWAENHQRELAEKAAREARAARGETYGYGMGDSTGGSGGGGGGGGGAPGEAGGPGGDSSGGDPSGEGGLSRGGQVNPNKQIRAALLTAKGVQAKAIGGGSFSGPKYPDVEKLAQAHDKFIYHSGTVDDLNNMKWGLEPQHGPWIQELANHAGDMEPEEIFDRATPLVWFSDSPSWVAAKVSRKLDKHVSDVTEDEIRQHGHVAIVPRKGDHAKHIYHVGEEGLNNGAYSSVKDLTGKTKKAYETELYDDNKEPFGVERNEYVSAKEVEPLLHLTGDHLVNFLRAVKRRGQPVGKSGGGALAAPGALTAKGVQAKAVPGKSKGGDVAPGVPVPKEEDGITAYHGSPHQFDEFDPEEDVHWFSEDETTARLYGKDRMKVPLNSPKKPVMYKVKINGNLQTRDPTAEAIAITKQINEPPPSNWDEVGNILQWKQYQNDVLDEARQSGFDGVRFVNVGDVPGNAGGKGHDTHYAITNPKVIQIKRRYSPGGEVEGGRVGYAGGGGEDDPTVQKALGLTQESMLPPAGSVLNHGDTYVGQNAPTRSEAGSQAGELPFGRSLPGGEGVVPSQHQAPLEGLPTRIKIPLTGEVITAGPNHLVRSVAEQYMRDAGLPYNPPKKYAKVDLTRGKRISNEYEQMEDNANHPLVKAAYDTMVKETMAQYRAAKAAGLKLSFWNPEKEKNPYEASPRLVIKDVNENHHMYVFPTQFGFGSKEISSEDVKRNPLLAPTGEHWNGIPVTVNDIFRAVHDYFGHAKEGSGFRSDGEENAWRSHASMYSPLARLALTSETRGQNSWLNFGPHGENNRNANTEDTVFAPQKVGIMPAWTAHEGAEDFISHEDRKVMEKIHKQYGRASGGRIGYGTGGGEDDPTVQKALGLTQQAQPNPVQMAQQMLPQAQPAPQANLMPKAVADQPVTQTTEDFNFNINRGKRKEVKAKLAPEDTQIINQIAQTHKLTPEEVEYSYRRIKNRFPTSEWAPFNIVGVQKDNEKVVRDAEGYPELKVQEQAYNFHKPKGSKDQRVGATDWDPAHLNRVTKSIVNAVKEVANREDAGDKNASVIMKARNWYRAMRDRLRQEYGGFADTMADTLGATSAQTGVRQNWDNTIEALSEFSRGSYDRALGKLQGWVDNGGEMGSASVAAGKGYINGHLNDLKAALPAATEQAKSEGLTNEKQIQKRAKDIAFQKAQEGEFPLITKADGRTLFNANTPATMMAFLDKFRERKAGDSPKTPNFTGNLIGYSDKATIDLWAARFLRRMAGMKPVPTASESGVSGSFLAAPLKTGIQTGGEFGFGQQAFQNAAKELRKDPRFAGLGDDDLQAIVWFLEKEHWTKNDWTNKTGEGGSFEQEANFAGVPDRAKLKELRQQSENDTTATDRQKISSFLSDKAPLEAAQKAYDENKWILEHGTSAKQRDAVMERMGITDKTQAVELAKSILGTAKAAGSTIQKYPAAEERLGALEQKSQETRTSATQQLNDMQAVARRFVGGLSPDREENPATPEIFAEGQSAIGQAVNSTPGVIMSKATPSRGRYIDPTGNIYDEKAYDLEFVTRQNFDPANTWKSIVSEGQRRNQQAVFLSEVVSPGVVENANPGMEVYFTKKLDDKATESLTKIINELGIDAGFTFVTDFRAKDRLAGGAPHGQYVGLRLQYIPELGGSPGGSEKAKDDMLRAIEKITNFDGVSHAKYVEYDTQVAMEDEYERHLAGHVPQGRQAAWHRQRFGAGNENPVGSQGVPQGNPSGAPLYRRRGGQTNARYQTQQTSLDPGLVRALQLTASMRHRG